MKDDKQNHSPGDEEMETKVNGSAESGKPLLTRRRKRQQSEQEKEETQKRGRVRLRILPIWLRVILILVWLAVVVALGLLIGYGLIGDGNILDIFKKETWTHIIDIINGKE